MVETEDYKHMYIFYEAKDCCEFWFGQHGSDSGCATNIIQGAYTNVTGSTNMTASMLEKWYPMLDERRCINDGNVPNWMMSETFRDYYLFNTWESCCAYFGYC